MTCDIAKGHFSSHPPGFHTGSAAGLADADVGVQADWTQAIAAGVAIEVSWVVAAA